MAEIVPEKSRTSIYALDRSFESVLASFAPPTVGLLAQYVYGYKAIPEGSTISQETEVDRENAASLAKALYAAICIPMVICLFFYSFLYSAYPRDRDQAKMDVLKASDIGNIETENQDSGEYYLQVSVSTSDGLHENLGLDENDAKRSLLH